MLHAVVHFLGDIDLFYPPLQAKFIAQLIVLGGQAVGRAFGQALKQEYRGMVAGVLVASCVTIITIDTFIVASMSARQTAEEEGRSGTRAAKASSLTGMSLSEAKQILDVQDLQDINKIKQVRC